MGIITSINQGNRIASRLGPRCAVCCHCINDRVIVVGQYAENSIFNFIFITNLVKIARVVTEICTRQTDRQTGGRTYTVIITPHPLRRDVLRVALLPSVPSTHHSHHPSLLHSFTPGLKPSFSANPFHDSLLFSASCLTPRIPRTVYRYF